ncbi:symmetrical bis(5'-nucleosyl)-tetraphosphatase [Pseudomonas sp. 10B1]|uniref:symmetrical bis(5'-nucleosyl)-tetraphosphatase n=1 Tax=unclassified Pseudomonas TaxID=196821 RepID=UPI002AB54A6D|nr:MULTISPECIES: symmetrical bis(5'-nucleosyl)-tetraphosphatase [unclassified Pseudomonas]MDY7562179.1 symmetrical bis(5'-nucleosyl)-tetraphosphatase [Pseudomonas sp. AB6]MEA9978933.1 symmetrical bis(5'-nucleosyl)-tetraphosphatase [Pseudomonas sp. RTS4]MEA9996112.1 symmetrical bis(5'-nucleosyl)-tetraphosphatase [Pseudomonas sp. AA4]MEB0087574.1 symmetrical bis(5'-nucleosyl)-tetraphosphatase [Pseudomonas sp. RTI1]MEB0127664.1 symmetrical bis(5'-nucleosyl)-tetraphosphatase [Pseudomonas sp. CCC1.
MAVYAVGDLQGCLEPLQCLLEHVAFDPTKDHLWLVGDLVNRGPASLETLRFLYGMRNSLVCVLGNHDLHLLAAARTIERLKKNDTLREVLEAADRDLLLEWLRQQKLMHYDPVRKIAMVHAGIAPQWTLNKALSYAKEVESALRDDNLVEPFLDGMYGNEPAKWQSSLQGVTRLRVITNYFTRMRFCTSDGTLDLKTKEGVGTALPGYAPWFSHPERKTKGQKIIFGHWAALEGKCTEPGIFALDTGCVWGGAMTLLNVDTLERHSCECDAKGMADANPVSSKRIGLHTISKG